MDIFGRPLFDLPHQLFCWAELAVCSSCGVQAPDRRAGRLLRTALGDGNLLRAGSASATVVGALPGPAPQALQLCCQEGPDFPSSAPAGTLWASLGQLTPLECGDRRTFLMGLLP